MSRPLLKAYPGQPSWEHSPPRPGPPHPPLGPPPPGLPAPPPAPPPRHPTHAERTARSDGGGAGDCGGRDAAPARAFLRGRDPEPAPVSRYVSAARGTARPIHGRDEHGLPREPRRARDRTCAGRAASSRRGRAGRGDKGDPGGQEAREGGPGPRRGTRLRRRDRQGDAQPPSSLPGASPRGSIALVRVAQARAATRARDFVGPEDVKELAPEALAHRLTVRGGTTGTTAESALKEILDSVPPPV